MPRTIVVFSGGLDSTTLIYHLRAEGHEVKAMFAAYGQRHLQRERVCAEAICRELGVEQRIVDLTTLVPLFGPNALTHVQQEMPIGTYTQSTIGLTTVPNRNMVLLAVGIAWAASCGFDAVAFGAHAGPHANYPDCRPLFAAAMDQAARVCHEPPIRVLAPFVNWSKADIVRRGTELQVPFAVTWSCYEGGARPCGRCGTCSDRRAAFEECGLFDPAQVEASS